MDLTEFTNFKLSEEANNLIVEVDSSIDDIRSDNLLISSVINDAKNARDLSIKHSYIIEQIANFDFDKQNAFTDKEEKIANPTDIRQDLDNLVIEISKKVHSPTTSKNKIVTSDYELSSSEKEEANLFESILDDWNKQQTISDRQHFISDISANTKSILFLTTKILNPWLKSEETFTEAAETLFGVVNCLPQETIDILYLQLLKEKGVELKDNIFLNDLIASLNHSQKNKLLCTFLNEVGKDMKCHTNIIYELIEKTILDNVSIYKLSESLVENIAHINNDRYFENIILLVAQQLSAETPSNIISLFSTLCNQIKGVMRFRIKNILKIITDDTTTAH